MLKAKVAKKVIAETIGVHISSIYRELKRNSSSKGKYNPRLAQVYADDRIRDKNRRNTFTDDMKKIIKEKILLDWSPEQINGYCRQNGIPMVSVETIYQYIYRDANNGGTLYTRLRTQVKSRRKRLSKYKKRGVIKNRVSIHERPEIVNERGRFGDWEIDLIEGENHKSFALTMVERKSSFCLIQKLKDKKAKTVEKAVVNMLAPYKKYVHTITSDNGREFMNHEAISAKLHTKFFFADPYSSWQRGLNEYTNKLIRQYIPKKSNIKDFDFQYIAEVARRLNSRPRKKLGYKSPISLFIPIFDG